MESTNKCPESSTVEKDTTNEKEKEGGNTSSPLPTENVDRLETNKDDKDEEAGIDSNKDEKNEQAGTETDQEEGNKEAGIETNKDGKDEEAGIETNKDEKEEEVETEADKVSPVEAKSPPIPQQSEENTIQTEESTLKDNLPSMDHANEDEANSEKVPLSEPKASSSDCTGNEETTSDDKAQSPGESLVSNTLDREEGSAIICRESPVPKEDTNKADAGIRPETCQKTSESSTIVESGSLKDSEICEEESIKQQSIPVSNEDALNESDNAGSAKDIPSEKKADEEEKETVVSIPNVGTSEEVKDSVDKESVKPSMAEPMDVDDEKEISSAQDKPPSEHEEDSHVLASADVDSENRDESMDVTTHEEENDPLSSTDKVQGEDRNEGCEVEIHTDIVKDEQFNDDSGDGEKSQDSTGKDKGTRNDDLGDGEQRTALPEKEKETSKEGSVEAPGSPEKNKESSKVPDDSTTQVPDETSKEVTDKTEGSSKSPVDATAKEADDEVCIVPDSVPQSICDKFKVITKSGTSLLKIKTTDPSTKGATEEEVVEMKGAPKEKRRSRSSRDVPLIDITTAPRPQRQAAKKAETQIKVLAAVESYEPPPDPKPTLTILDRVTEANPCQQCGLVTFCKYQMPSKDSFVYFCRELCYNEYQSPKSSDAPIMSDPPSVAPVANVAELERPFKRTCSMCTALILAHDEKVLTWETMDFCNEECLGKYQTALGSHCANCKGAVQNASLGKYCVRFGYNIKQFCCAGCLEEFKKGLKVCSYCQKDISSDQGGFLAPVGDKGQFKDFCTPSCMEKYEQMSSTVTPPTPCHECAVCMKLEPVRVEVLSASRVHKLCSQPCFAAFKFVNAIVADQCDMCKKYFDKAKTDNFTIFYDDAPHSFCCKTCMNVYILAKRKIVPCSWCKVKKYNFDMIKKVTSVGQVVMMCSLHCLNLYQVSSSAVTPRRVKCDACNTQVLAQYHLTMSDGSVRNFCSYNCVGVFQKKFSRTAIAAGGRDGIPVPTGGPKRAITRRSMISTETETTVGKSSPGGPLPVISSVTSLAPNGEPLPAGTSIPGTIKVRAQVRNYGDREPADVSKSPSEGGKSTVKQHIIVRPPHQPRRHNRGLQVQPITHNKGVSIKPQCCTKETQTDDEFSGKIPIIVPVPIPIYVPTPMCMYSLPTPLPVPFPLPIPVPIFIPTTRNSTQGIMKEIKRIQEKIPNDPFEAELLMMAEMVAAEKKPENADGSDSEPEGNAPEEKPAATTSDAGNGVSQTFSPEAVDSSNTFGDDIMQMALKFASTLDDTPVDFDAAVAPSTIVSGGGHNDEEASDSDPDDPDEPEPKTRSRKRALRSSSRSRSQSSGPKKRSRRVSSTESLPLPSDASTASTKPDAEKPDAHLSLKFTYGVNAWRQWVLQKNAQLEKAATSNRKLKLFKTDLLQLTADELNYSLCLFVKEVRKPNGTEYAPDTIYYLCLGIQLYLISNGRSDNIFSDPFYEKFTEYLDEMSKKFCSLYDDTQFIVTRVEEEHLWESKQLGAHSPQVLLSTLMFFNTKHFNITTVDEHMSLSFSHIMKHWKRQNNAPGAGKVPGRNVLLRFYPSQAVLDSNSKKKKVYEQSENEDNPLRCPVKLYEFYLSKCPESVKTRNDVFYLQPERSCVPDSPVWYSTMSLGKETLLKMLRRVKMVKEINMAILK